MKLYRSIGHNEFVNLFEDSSKYGKWFIEEMKEKATKLGIEFIIE